MMQYGTETTMYVDGDKAMEVTDNVRNYKVFSTFKRTITRTKVSTPGEADHQYQLFSNHIDKLHRLNKLLTKSNDPALRPSFTIEYPHIDHDGSYFVITSYTEIVM
jgi:hypothetical protein